MNLFIGSSIFGAWPRPLCRLAGFSDAGSGDDTEGYFDETGRALIGAGGATGGGRSARRWRSIRICYSFNFRHAVRGISDLLDCRTTLGGLTERSEDLKVPERISPDQMFSQFSGLALKPDLFAAACFGWSEPLYDFTCCADALLQVSHVMCEKPFTKSACSCHVASTWFLRAA